MSVTVYNTCDALLCLGVLPVFPFVLAVELSTESGCQLQGFFKLHIKGRDTISSLRGDTISSLRGGHHFIPDKC
jgi:hypothetical protein